MAGPIKSRLKKTPKGAGIAVKVLALTDSMKIFERFLKDFP